MKSQGSQSALDELGRSINRSKVLPPQLVGGVAQATNRRAQLAAGSCS